MGKVTFNLQPTFAKRVLNKKNEGDDISQASIRRAQEKRSGGSLALELVKFLELSNRHGRVQKKERLYMEDR